MKKITYLTLIFLTITVFGFGQRYRVSENFVITINNSISRTISNAHLILSDSTTSKQIIQCGYIPGELFINRLEDKKILEKMDKREITLVFDNYETVQNEHVINHYEILMNSAWFSEPFIILKIDYPNKRKKIYKYSFEIPGYFFGRN